MAAAVAAVRRVMEEGDEGAGGGGVGGVSGRRGNNSPEARPCRLTVSTPVLKAPMVSPLESGIVQNALNICFQFELAPIL